jgi:SAM-dependent methyltransferase
MDGAATRYLEAKRSVDDRALSRRVRDRLLEALPDVPRVLEAGCGTGVTVPRLLDWGVTAGSYRGVDRDEGVVSFAREVRPAEMRRAGHGVVETDGGFAAGDFEVRFEVGDALVVFGDGGDAGNGRDAGDAGDADLFVASAFADLVPLDALVDAFETALRPGGLAYLPITFDGGTVFQPDHPADDAVGRAYHRAIDGVPGRDARAGRHLVDLLGRRSGDLLSVAASDWIVRPRGEEYPADEAYFLGCILGFVEEALWDADEPVPGLDGWLRARRDQLAAGELTYVAHQYDLLYRTPEP